MSTRPRARCGAALILALGAGPAAAQAVYLGAGEGLSTTGDEFAHAVAQLRDTDGDGINEILVGSPYDDTNGTDSGTVYVLNGQYGYIVDQVHGLAGDQLGWSVANVGDVDGDGIDDFAAGRPGRDQGSADWGAVSVYSGDGANILWTQVGPKIGARHGSVVAAAGDVDGDGDGDVLVGAPSYDGPNALTDKDWGRVVLYSGSNGLVLETILGDDESDRLGAALAGLPDLNGDGLPEFAIGVPGNEVGSPFSILNAGSVHVYSGPTQALLFTINGSSANEAAGSSVCGLGDTDLDGLQEFAVGRPGWSSDRGRVTVHEGPTGTLIATHLGPQYTPADAYGTSVCGAGDVDKDGRPDLLVAATAAGTGFGGWAHVLSGNGWAQYGDTFNSYADQGFGTAVAAGLDSSGDGWVDAIFGLPQGDNDGTDSGYLWGYRFTHYQPDILFGGPGTASLQMYGTELYTGGKADLLFAGGQAFRPVYLLASLNDEPTPFKGGVLVPQVSTSLLVTLATDASGQVKLTDVPGGGGYALVFLQALTPMIGTPDPYWITNAITAQLLP